MIRITMPRTIRAGDEFRAFSGRTYDTATLRWRVESGADCRPGQAIGDLCFGQGPAEGVPSTQEDGTALGVGAEAFGTVRLLQPDGATVRPGDVLAEFVERAPTLAEWEQEWWRAVKAHDELTAFQDRMRNPFRAVAYSVRQWLVFRGWLQK